MSHHDWADLQLRLRHTVPTGERQLALFVRQFLQRIPLSLIQWPSAQLLSQYDVQHWLYETLINSRTYQVGINNTDTHGYQQDSAEVVTRWEREVWNELSKRVEAAARTRSDEADVCDGLIEEAARLCRKRVRPETEEVMQEGWITYEIDPAFDLLRKDPLQIRLLERTRVLSGSQCTGHRTWEAALALGTEILSRREGTDKDAKCGFVVPDLAGLRVLELGAGTGLVSFVCAARCCAPPCHVFATDADENVVRSMGASRDGNLGALSMCPLEFDVFKWGDAIEESCLKDRQFDVLLAADVAYDAETIPALVCSISELRRRNKGLQVILSCARRNVDTFDVLIKELGKKELSVNVSTSPLGLELENQDYLFHVNEGAIRFVLVTGG